MKTSPLSLVAAALASAAGLAHAQVDTAAKQKLDQMVDAVKQARALSYKCEFFGASGFFAMLPTIHVEVTQKRGEQNPSTWLVRAEGRRDATTGAGAIPAVDILVVGEGSRRVWIDAPNKTVYERTETQANGDAVMAANLAIVREMIEPDPFSKEVASPTVKPEADAKADGVDCDVITVDKGPNLDSTKWTIGKADHLPRMVERTMNGVGTQVWKLTNVKLNPDAPASLFEIPTPKDFHRDGAAPPPPAAPAANGENAAKPAAAPTAPTRITGTDINNLAPDFELPTPKGDKVKLSGLRGNVVVLDFWGTWCLPCKKASPEVQKLTDDYKDRIKVFGLAINEKSDEKPAEYMTEHKYTYGLLLHGDDVAKDLYKVKAYPSYIVIGKEGEIVHIASGYEPDKTFTEIRQAVDSALAGPAAGTTIIKPAPKAPAAPTGTPSADK